MKFEWAATFFLSSDHLVGKVHSAAVDSARGYLIQEIAAAIETTPVLQRTQNTNTSICSVTSRFIRSLQAKQHRTNIIDVVV